MISGIKLSAKKSGGGGGETNALYLTQTVTAEHTLTISDIGFKPKYITVMCPSAYNTSYNLGIHATYDFENSAWIQGSSYQYGTPTLVNDTTIYFDLGVYNYSSQTAMIVVVG